MRIFFFSTFLHNPTDRPYLVNIPVFSQLRARGRKIQDVDKVREEQRFVVDTNLKRACMNPESSHKTMTYQQSGIQIAADRKHVLT